VERAGDSAVQQITDFLRLWPVMGKNTIKPMAIEFMIGNSLRRPAACVRSASRTIIEVATAVDH
jgi:hypothetical protein